MTPEELEAAVAQGRGAAESGQRGPGAFHGWIFDDAGDVVVEERAAQPSRVDQKDHGEKEQGGARACWHGRCPGFGRLRHASSRIEVFSMMF